MPDQPKTEHRSVRISDDDWRDLLAAAKTQSSDRGTVIKEFVAWYLRRPGAKQPVRPDAAAWQRLITTDGSDRYHASESCPAFQSGRSGNEAQGIELRPVVTLTAEEAEVASQTKCAECLGGS
ncbi:hypothetical protein ACFTXJ_15390 [Streptomyces zhihengii]|uniref:hypothetical protein n=1 Tax=Streptomyces zhihengii TaxID=1818004 RepID=UPI003643057B